MTFYRNGKHIDYTEVVETLTVLVEQEILNELEDDEVRNLYIRLFDYNTESTHDYLKKIGCKDVDIHEFYEALDLMLEDSGEGIWNQATMYYNESIEGNSKKEELIAFIYPTFIEAIRNLNSKLVSKL